MMRLAALLCLLQDAEWKQYKKGDRLTMTWTFEQTYKGTESGKPVFYRDSREVDAVLTCTGEYNNFKIELKSVKWHYAPNADHRLVLTVDGSGTIKAEENTLGNEVLETHTKFLKRDQTWQAGLTTPSPWAWGSGAINGLFDWLYPGEYGPEGKLEPETSWKRKISYSEEWLPIGHDFSKHKNKVLFSCRKEGDEIRVAGTYSLEDSQPYELGSCTGKTTLDHRIKIDYKIRKTGLPLWTQLEIKSVHKRETTEKMFSYEVDYSCRQTLLIRE